MLEFSCVCMQPLCLHEYGDVGPDMYEVIYHPAFDGIKETPDYLELLDQYGPEIQQQ